jgi:hypothetical protein
MTITNCLRCGGTHFGSNECPYIELPCVVCGKPTIMACADCSIENGGAKSVHVCADPKCRGEHERLNPQHPKTGYGENYGRKFEPTPGSIDHTLLIIDSQRRQLQKQFDADMAVLDRRERSVLGLKE